MDSTPVDSTSADSTSADSTADASATTHTVTVCTGQDRHEIDVEPEVTLRQALRRHGFSPHNTVTEVANCGGRGHCGLCLVEITDGAPTPSQALDDTLSGMGMGRLSCLVTVDRDMTVQL
jgi:ferredoxin